MIQGRIKQINVIIIITIIQEQCYVDKERLKHDMTSYGFHKICFYLIARKKLLIVIKQQIVAKFV